MVTASVVFGFRLLLYLSLSLSDLVDPLNNLLPFPIYIKNHQKMYSFAQEHRQRRCEAASQTYRIQRVRQGNTKQSISELFCIRAIRKVLILRPKCCKRCTEPEGLVSSVFLVPLFHLQASCRSFATWKVGKRKAPKERWRGVVLRRETFFSRVRLPQTAFCESNDADNNAKRSKCENCWSLYWASIDHFQDVGRNIAIVVNGTHVTCSYAHRYVRVNVFELPEMRTTFWKGFVQHIFSLGAESNFVYFFCSFFFCVDVGVRGRSFTFVSSKSKAISSVSILSNSSGKIFHPPRASVVSESISRVSENDHHCPRRDHIATMKWYIK